MSRITAINPSEAAGRVKELLDAVQAKLGVTPNMMRTMAQSPAVLEAYLNFSDALGKGKLKAKFREQIALLSAEANQCGYCAAAHTAIGKMVGLNEKAILAARGASAEDPQTDAALKFARAIIEKRGAAPATSTRRRKRRLIFPA
jgi:AhpD family alkylhydroperoxidase